jgi:carbonic anhydrase/acetyltransferase-like protein (isoleucine patch superfamily)
MAELSKTSIRPNPNGDIPQVDPTAYIDPTAQLIGNVHIGPEVFVGPYAIIRADEIDAEGKVHPITIGPRCNVQDSVIIHALGGTEVTIGQQTSLSHGCVIHGPCTIGQDCFIGFRAVVYNVALPNGIFVSASSVVQEVDLPESSFVPPAVAILSADDVAAKVTKTTPTDRQFMQRVINANLTLAKEYSRLNQN